MQSRFYFYPRSPCGERPRKSQSSRAGVRISIHALLAESDVTVLGIQHRTGISIHALLAESDNRDIANSERKKNISIHALLAESDYDTSSLMQCQAKFLSTLSLRRATPFFQTFRRLHKYFYPRSPCGERLHYDNYNLHCTEISIHALLAESDFACIGFH